MARTLLQTCEHSPDKSNLAPPSQVLHLGVGGCSMFAKGQTPPEPLVDLPVDNPEELPSSKSVEIAQSCHGLEGGTDGHESPGVLAH